MLEPLFKQFVGCVHPINDIDTINMQIHYKLTQVLRLTRVKHHQMNNC